MTQLAITDLHKAFRADRSSTGLDLDGACRTR